MRLALDPHSLLPIHAQIADGIRLAIARGQLAPGDQVPTVRQLSVELKVNSNTVARVYADLERTGVLETRRGRGTFVRASAYDMREARDQRLRALCRAFATNAAQEGFTLRELREELLQLGKDEP
jgi:GntR family transcriptional regulator